MHIVSIIFNKNSIQIKIGRYDSWNGKGSLNTNKLKYADDTRSLAENKNYIAHQKWNVKMSVNVKYKENKGTDNQHTQCIHK